MKLAYQVVVITAAVFAVLLLAPAPGLGQVTDDERAEMFAAELARFLSRRFEARARQLTVFDREGNVVNTIGVPDLYSQPTFSPDRTRVAVIKSDLGDGTRDLWVFDLGTGNGTRITSSQPGERVVAPAWSPDGSQVAYVAVRGSYFGIYRQALNGEGEEELLYQHPGGAITLTDWSLDGRFLSFSSNARSGGTLYIFPLDGDGQVIEIERSESNIRAARLSPDSRFLAYWFKETGRNEIFVRAVAPSGGAQNASVEKWQVSNEGGLGMVSWRRDGQELYYLGDDRRVMAVQVNTAQGFEFGRPTPLFKAPDAIPVTGTPDALGSVSQDGQRVVFAVPPERRLRQITIVDRGGNVLQRVGEPGLISQPSFSPDGSRVAVLKENLETGNVDVWTFNVATGEGLPVTSNDFPENGAHYPVWFPDGTRVAYVSIRGDYAGIYLKAWNGEGDEELLFRYTPGAFLRLIDFSADGRFLTFDSGAVILVVSLTGTDPLAREAVDFSREEFRVGAARFSPESRFMAYNSNESGRFEVYVRPIDATTGMALAEARWQVSDNGTIGGIFWRQDGKEIFYVEHDRTLGIDDLKVMAVDVTTTPDFQVETPRLLFRLFLPRLQVGNPTPWKNVSADGQRFVFAIPVPSE